MLVLSLDLCTVLCRVLSIAELTLENDILGKVGLAGCPETGVKTVFDESAGLDDRIFCKSSAEMLLDDNVKGEEVVPWQSQYMLV